MGKLYCGLLILILSWQLCIAREAVNDETDLQNFRTVQYVNVSGISPKQAMFADNNAEILMACVTGKTKQQLADLDIDVSESQLLLLKAIRLLEQKNDTLKTAFPILGREQTALLRARTKAAADALYPEIFDDVKLLVTELDRMGRKQNTYTFLFSFVLDGLIWDSFQGRNLMEKNKITAEKPFWDGAVWSVFPPRAFSCGTNSSHESGFGVYMNWSKQAPRSIWTFWGDRKNRMQMLKDYTEYGYVKNPEVINAFKQFNLFDDNGRITIPVIEVKPGNKLFDTSKRITERIAAKIPNILNLQQLTRDFNFPDNGQGLIIAYHEIMWDLMAKFEQELIEKPVAFANPEKAASEHVADLVFIVKFE